MYLEWNHIFIWVKFSFKFSLRIEGLLHGCFVGNAYLAVDDIYKFKSLAIFVSFTSGEESLKLEHNKSAFFLIFWSLEVTYIVFSSIRKPLFSKRADKKYDPDEIRTHDPQRLDHNSAHFAVLENLN